MDNPSEPKQPMRTRIILPVLLILLLAVGILTGIGLYYQDTLLISQEEAHLDSLVRGFNAKNDLHGKMALSLATSIAFMPEVQDLFARQDRQGLQDYLNPLYQTLRTDFNVEQAQFHLAPATSFLRLNKPETFGDDLSAIRAMVVTANKEERTLSGLEFGVTGFGIRGITPVKQNAKTLGTFEIGMSFDKKLLEGFKATSGAEYSLLVAETADPQAFKIHAATLEKPLNIPIDIRQEVFGGGKSAVTLVKDENGAAYTVITAPVRDYSQKIICLVEIATLRTETLAASQRNQTVILLLGIGVFLIAGALMFWTVERFSRQRGQAA